MSALFVKCDVRTGLFKTEYLVSVPPGANNFYIDRTDVKVSKAPIGNETVDGMVLAYLIEDGPNEAVVEMTGTPVDGGLRISVPKAMTRAA